jgi:hypothetical protein
MIHIKTFVMRISHVIDLTFKEYLLLNTDLKGEILPPSLLEFAPADTRVRLGLVRLG